MRLLLAITLLCPTFLLAQRDDYNKWELGVNAGAYKAHKSTAIRYDGSDVEYDPLYRDVQYYVFDLAPSNQYSYYNRIFEIYNQQNFALAQAPYPENVRYNFGVALGLHVGYRTTEMNTFFVDADFTDLKITDAITFEVENPASQVSEPTINIERLFGHERRLNVNVGMHFGLGTDPDNTPYLQLGANMTAARVQKISLFVQEQEFVLVQWSRNFTNPNFQQVDFGGTGFGGFAGAGYRYRLSDQFVVDGGINTMFTKVNIGPKLFQKFKPQYLFYLRILWS